ncbi:tyrosine-protein phosphatase [Pseudoalteromonas ulvae]|uniref:Protein phosphatase n=1 Tax=Pseudoalteromonas ulvae TaxID=107327 RepID=A0A244CVC3_PSEDV|nr:tyrosine-protein phosphatase [Pseudoalteromonas ulvae]OUL59580.1 protein phosphatase [Pseudoalteromonas ulvae]
MHTHPYDTLILNNGASFIFTPCPGTKEVALDSSVSQLKEAGAQAILSIMYDEEMLKLGAEQLPTVCKTLGMKWFQLPVSDDDAPNNDFEVAFNNHLTDVLSILTNQGTVAVHCKGGSGRTGLVIGLLMAQLGYDKADVVTQVQNIRPKALTHPVQLAYFNNFKM